MEGPLYIAQFIPISQQTWTPQEILVSDWSISRKRSSPLKPLGQMNRNLIVSIYGRSSINCAVNPDQVTDMATIGQFKKKSSPLKPSNQMNRNLIRSTYRRFCIKFPESRMKGGRHRLSPLSLQFLYEKANCSN